MPNCCHHGQPGHLYRGKPIHLGCPQCHPRATVSTCAHCGQQTVTEHRGPHPDREAGCRRGKLLDEARLKLGTARAKRHGWKVSKWTPDEAACALGIHPRQLGDIIYGAVWFGGITKMEGYEYSPTLGQLYYPVAYFRKKKVRARVAEDRVTLLSVNFRRKLRGEPSLTFEESRALDRKGKRWRTR